MLLCVLGIHSEQREVGFYPFYASFAAILKIFHTPYEVKVKIHNHSVVQLENLDTFLFAKTSRIPQPVIYYKHSSTVMQFATGQHTLSLSRTMYLSQGIMLPCVAHSYHLILCSTTFIVRLTDIRRSSGSASPATIRHNAFNEIRQTIKNVSTVQKGKHKQIQIDIYFIFMFQKSQLSNVTIIA